MYGKPARKGALPLLATPLFCLSLLNSSGGCAKNGRVACPAASAPRLAAKDLSLKAP